MPTGICVSIAQRSPPPQESDSCKFKPVMTEEKREDESVTHLKIQLLSPRRSKSHHPGKRFMHFLKEKNLGAENTSPTPKPRTPCPGLRKRRDPGRLGQCRPSRALPPPLPWSPCRPARQHPGSTHLRWLGGRRPATSPATLSRPPGRPATRR